MNRYDWPDLETLADHIGSLWIRYCNAKSRQQELLTKELEEQLFAARRWREKMLRDLAADL
jgi:hypothetical protein